MISLDAALGLLLAGVEPLGGEEVALEASLGRTLAQGLVAARDQPALPTSAMDGYAVTAADAVVGRQLKIVGTAYAGAPFAGRLEAGQAVRIATGGIVPRGADRVVMQEVVTRDGGSIAIDGPLGEAPFVREAGGDYRAGDLLVEQGAVMTPGRLGLAASAGFASLGVRRRPRVAIFASGDELRQPGEPLAPGETVDSAGIAIAALVAAWGGLPDRRAVLADDHQRAKAAIGAVGEADVMLFIGGASVGDRDVLRAVIADLGGRMRFDRIAVQPGKPSWHARFDDGGLVLGLPGNPASAFVCAYLLLRPLVEVLLGARAREPDFARLGVDLPAAGERETYWRARLSLDAVGHRTVMPDPARDSSLQRPLASANALLRQPAATALRTGEAVEVIAFGEPPA